MAIFMISLVLSTKAWAQSTPGSKVLDHKGPKPAPQSNAGDTELKYLVIKKYKM